MPLDIKTLCQYRLERAKEDLLTAESNHQADSQIQLEHAHEFVNAVEIYLKKKFSEA